MDSSEKDSPRGSRVLHCVVMFELEPAELRERQEPISSVRELLPGTASNARRVDPTTVQIICLVSLTSSTQRDAVERGVAYYDSTRQASVDFGSEFGPRGFSFHVVWINAVN